MGCASAGLCSHPTYERYVRPSRLPSFMDLTLSLRPQFSTISDIFRGWPSRKRLAHVFPPRRRPTPPSNSIHPAPPDRSPTALLPGFAPLSAGVVRSCRSVAWPSADGSGSAESSGWPSPVWPSSSSQLLSSQIGSGQLPSSVSPPDGLREGGESSDGPRWLRSGRVQKRLMFPIPCRGGRPCRFPSPQRVSAAQRCCSSISRTSPGERVNACRPVLAYWLPAVARAVYEPAGKASKRAPAAEWNPATWLTCAPSDEAPVSSTKPEDANSPSASTMVTRTEAVPRRKMTGRRLDRSSKTVWIMPLLPPCDTSTTSGSPSGSSRDRKHQPLLSSIRANPAGALRRLAALRQLSAPLNLPFRHRPPAQKPPRAWPNTEPYHHCPKPHRMTALRTVVMPPATLRVLASLSRFARGPS